MVKIARIACAAVVLAGALFVSQLSVPSVTVACSCRSPGNVAELAADPDVLVLTGFIVAVTIHNGQFGPQTSAQLTVHRVFQGQVVPGSMSIRGGDGANCVPMIENGWNVVLSARIVEGILEPVPCGHFGLLTTPEGQALLRDVEAAFGRGAGPAPATDENANLASLALLAVGVLVAVVLLGAVLLALGRRDRAAE